MDTILNINKRNVVVGLGVVAVGLVGYYAYTVYVFNAQDPVRRFEIAMKADIEGGKTPEETLRLFISALRAGDIDLASRYFMLDDALSREKWRARLLEIREKGLLGQMVEDIEKNAEPDLEARISETDFKFAVYAPDGTIGADIDLELNEFSGVWKIQSF